MIKNSTKLNTFDYLQQIGVITDEHIEMAEKWVGEIQQYRHQVPIENIADLICDYFFISRKDIESKNGKDPIKTAKKLFYYLAKCEGYSWHTIGAVANKSRPGPQIASESIERDINPQHPNYDKRLRAIVMFLRDQLHCENIVKE